MAKEEKFNTTYKDYKAGVNGRLNFNKISGDTPLPYLVEIQTDSYKWFLEKGINEVLAEVFPIENYAGTAAIDYVSCRLEPAQYDPLECKAADLTYSSKLKVTLRLSSKATGEIKEAVPIACEELGFNLLSCGHHRTEIFGVRALATKIQAELGIPACFVDIDNEV